MLNIVIHEAFGKVTEFLANNFSSPTHWPEWNVAVSRHYSTTFAYFCAYEGKELIGICPVHKVKDGYLTQYFSGQFRFIPYGGWIFSRPVKTDTLSFPLGYFGGIQCFALPQIDDFNAPSSPDATQKEFQTLLVDLRDDLDVIWKGQIDSKRRNMIRKAEKSEVDVSSSHSFSNEFYALYRQAGEANNLSLMPEGLFIDLFGNARNVNFEIFSAYRGNMHLADAVVVYDKNYAIYWLGNNATDAPNLGQGELLQWEIIQRTKALGCTWYDLCYIEKERLPHIYRFKSGFSKSEVEVPYFAEKKLLFKVLNKIKKKLSR